MNIGDDFTKEKLAKYAYKIDQEATADCRYVGNDYTSTYESTDVANKALVALASEVLEKQAEFRLEDFRRVKNQQGVIDDFEFNNMYDGCRMPVFDRYGFNKPCPKFDDLVDMGKRIQNEVQDQIDIHEDIASASLDWRKYCDSDQDCYEMGTGWSFVWAWNMAWSIMLFINFVILTFGAYYWWPRFIGTVMNYALCPCHLAGVILMIVGVTNPYARMCQYNKATSTYDEKYWWHWDRQTYEDDYHFMLYGAMGMGVCWCIQVCLCCIPCYWTPTKEIIVPLKDEKEKYNDKETDLSELAILPIQNRPSKYPSFSEKTNTGR